MNDSKRLGDVQVLAYELDNVLRGTMAGDPLALVAKIGTLALPATNDALPTEEDRAYTAGENVGRDEAAEEARVARKQEREAWARLVKATITLHILAMCSAVAGAVDPKSTQARRDLAPERDAVDAARQALRDLGVDVDLLIK
jgi:hypothetical protein